MKKLLTSFFIFALALNLLIIGDVTPVHGQEREGSGDTNAAPVCTDDDGDGVFTDANGVECDDTTDDGTADDGATTGDDATDDGTADDGATTGDDATDDSSADDGATAGDDATDDSSADDGAAADGGLSVDEPPAADPVTEEPAAEEPSAEEPAADESLANELVTEEPPAEEPTTEEWVGDKPPADEPAAISAAEGDIGTQAFAGTFNTRFTVQNVGGAAASGSVTLYPKNSSTAAQTINFSNLGAGASKHYGPNDITGSSFDGSAVVSADQALAAVVRMEVLSTNTGKTNVGYARGYDSNQIGTTLYAPSVYRNYFGYYSEISIQNAHSGPNTVTLTFQDDSGVIGGTTPTTLNFTGQGEVQRLDMTNVTGLPTGNAGITNSGGWVGVLKLVANNGPIAGQIFAYNLTQASAANAWFHHDAVVAGSTLNGGTGKYEAYAPTAYNNVFGQGSDLGWSNSFQLVDISGNTGAINCTISFLPLSISANQTSLANQPVSFNFFFAGFVPLVWGPSLGNNWVGTAKVACDRPFAGVVNLSYRRTSATIKPLVSSQELLFGGGTQVYYPDARNTGGSSLPNWGSAIVVMNLGTANATVTLQGFNKNNSTGTPDWTLSGFSELTVTPGSGTGIFLGNPSYSAVVPSTFEGSVKATATSSAAVVIHGAVNYAYNGAETGADEWGVYTAFPQ